MEFESSVVIRRHHIEVHGDAVTYGEQATEPPRRRDAEIGHADDVDALDVEDARRVGRQSCVDHDRLLDPGNGEASNEAHGRHSTGDDGFVPFEPEAHGRVSGGMHGLLQMPIHDPDAAIQLRERHGQ